MSDRQNAVVDAGNDCVLAFTITADAGVTLNGAQIDWYMAATRFDGVDYVAIHKSTETVPGGITQTGDLTFSVALDAADTAELGGDYYHEAEVEDASGNIVTVTVGHISVRRTLGAG